jgi:hypothetical protein
MFDKKLSVFSEALSARPISLKFSRQAKPGNGLSSGRNHVPQAFLERVISEHWEADRRNVEIIPQFLARDPLIEALVRQLMVEGRNGSPSGRLYAESACEFLAHQLIHSYSSLSAHPPQHSGGLSGRRLRAVLGLHRRQPRAANRVAAISPTCRG